MNVRVDIDWKFVVALGVTAVGIIFAMKMDTATVKEASIHAIDAGKEYAFSRNRIC